MDKEKYVSIVLLNYNGAKDTIECIESINNSIYKNYKIVVIDNLSSDNSVSILKKWFKDKFNDEKIIIDNYWLSENNVKCIMKYSNITFIEANSNEGFARGNNIGIQYSLDFLDIDYIWLLNNDTIINNRTLNQLVKRAETMRENDVIGSTVIEYYDKNVIQCTGGAKFNKYLALGSHLNEGLKLEDLNSINENSLKLDYISGCSMFFNAKVFQNIGYLNTEYFLYFEEIDFCTRIKEKGGELIWCKDSFIWHKGGASIGSQNLINKKSEISEYNSNLSALRFTRKHYPHNYLLVYILRFLLKCIKFIIKREWYLFPALLKSYRMISKEKK